MLGEITNWDEEALTFNIEWEDGRLWIGFPLRRMYSLDPNGRYADYGVDFV